MYIYFSTYHEACLFVSVKQSEGYFAEVIHTHAGHMWGEQTLGFGVIVSENQRDQGLAEPIATKVVYLWDWLNRFVYWILLASMALSVMLAVYWMILVGMHFVYIFQIAPKFGFYTILFLLITVVFTVSSYSAYRNNNNPFYKASQVVYGLIALLLMLIRIVF